MIWMRRKSFLLISSFGDSVLLLFVVVAVIIHGDRYTNIIWEPNTPVNSRMRQMSATQTISHSSFTIHFIYLPIHEAINPRCYRFAVSIDTSSFPLRRNCDVSQLTNYLFRLTQLFTHFVLEMEFKWKWMTTKVFVLLTATRTAHIDWHTEIKRNETKNDMKIMDLFSVGLRHNRQVGPRMRSNKFKICKKAIDKACARIAHGMVWHGNETLQF